MTSLPPRRDQAHPQAWSNLLSHPSPPAKDASNSSSSLGTTSSGRSTQAGSILPQYIHRPLGHPITCHSSVSPARRGASVLHLPQGLSRASKCLLIICWKRGRNGRSPFYRSTNNDELLSMYQAPSIIKQKEFVHPALTEPNTKY